eukprot:Lankesteria_metandrocarpae@DN1607_c0_g1_i1.p1
MRPAATAGVCRRLAILDRLSRYRLRYTHHVGVRPEVICRTIKSCPSLRVLDLSHCRVLSSTALRELSVSPSLPRKLKALSFRDCSKLTNVALRQFLYRLKRHLTVLDLLHCPD